MRTAYEFHDRTSPRAFLLVGATLLVNALARAAAIGQEVDRTIDGPERAAVIDGLVEQIKKIYFYPDVASQMEQAIRARQAKKEYDAILSCQELAKTLTQHLREVCKDNHLNVEFFAQGIPYDSEKKPDPREVEEFRKRGMRRNYEFKKVERLEGGIGLLQVDGFYPAEWIGETAAAAMSFLANSEAVILDLRHNSGGQSGGTLLCSYFFREETHLEDVYNRPENTTRQVWSYPVVAGAKFADKDLYILTSKRTFSAPEALACDMQALKRATIVGERTGGGAHGTTIYRITDHFSASIPFCRSINPVTRTDWEGSGVRPDVAVPADQALLAAHLLALKKALTKYADNPGFADNLKTVIASKEKELEARNAK
jgi:retinol-binding protein 3